MTDRDGEDQAFVDAISEWPDINDGPTLAGFLLARTAEDEAEAREYRHYQENVYEAAGWWDCDRVLAECEAKRRIVGLWNLRLSDAGNPLGGEAAEVYYDAIRLLALPYADHPAYREAWRP